MDFDYSKLKGKIKEVFDNQQKYANALTLSNTAVSNKLNNKVQFTQQEMYLSLVLFNIPDEEKPVKLLEYFFTPKVEKVQR